MKRFILFAFILTLAAAVALPVLAEGGFSYSGSAYPGLLSNLTHNCKQTGIMLPAQFSPYVNTYLLTVGNNVSRPRFTPTAYDPSAVITVNGQTVQSGQESNYIAIGDKPVAVEISVSSGGVTNLYTVYIQRRPSEKRTKVSAGYINRIYQDKNVWKMDPDLVTLSYAGGDYTSGNLSTFTNKTKEVNSKEYVRPLSANCIYYYGTKENCFRARNLEEFLNNYTRYESNPMFTIIYQEDEIVAVLPYGADY